MDLSGFIWLIEDSRPQVRGGIANIGDAAILQEFTCKHGLQVVSWRAPSRRSPSRTVKSTKAWKNQVGGPDLIFEAWGVPHGGRMGATWEPLGAAWGLLGGSSGHLGAHLGGLGVVLGPSSGLLGAHL